ncbi:hypothetical protein pEaSNUABM50_00343 [Erwinia phage pEa_SNUABM_50]|uniref:Uncharacterized protein n=1 Tax=Erwinia phage pEa_SNUABM_50 TaxID=2768775 RepID=A0A7L8ZPZ4_9CAUD|nr:hypothetical protein pEaSNUABM50_00343 [Erwinia phage pEa_SNUABM_50]QXO12041.1 hypothetical protein pEaSNUABM44_00345 [Erwinia phage pEa_SNUABM_44]
MFEFEQEPIYNPDEDGITHINIYSQAKTELGRLLSNFAHSPFVYEPYGKFESGEGFWYWYLTGQQHDSLRYLSGFEAKKEGKKYRNDRLDVLGLTDEDLEVMMQMLVLKVAYNPHIASLLKESTLPFCHYYNYSGRVIMCTEFDWLSSAYADIRTVLNESN